MPAIAPGFKASFDEAVAVGSFVAVWLSVAVGPDVELSVSEDFVGVASVGSVVLVAWDCKTEVFAGLTAEEGYSTDNF